MTKQFSKRYSWHFGLDSSGFFKTEIEAMRDFWQKWPGRSATRIQETWVVEDVPEDIDKVEEAPSE